MANYLKFGSEQLGPNGLIPLRRGDDWDLRANVTSTPDFPSNLTGGLLQIHFPQTQDPNTPLPDYVVQATVVDSKTNRIAVAVPGTASTGITLSDNNGTAIFGVFTDSLGKQTTYETPSPVLDIRDRGFTNYS